MARLRQWCETSTRVQKDVKYDFVYVEEESFEKYKPASFRQLMDGFQDTKLRVWKMKAGLCFDRPLTRKMKGKFICHFQ